MPAFVDLVPSTPLKGEFISTEMSNVYLNVPGGTGDSETDASVLLVIVSRCGSFEKTIHEYPIRKRFKNLLYLFQFSIKKLDTRSSMESKHERLHNHPGKIVPWRLCVRSVSCQNNEHPFIASRSRMKKTSASSW
jgi:hypothetical protein